MASEVEAAPEVEARESLTEREPSANGASGRTLGLIAGVGAAGAAGIAILLMRAALGGPSLTELIDEYIVSLTPGPVFSFVLDRLRFTGKPLLLALVLLGQLGVGAAIGAFYASRIRQTGDALKLAAAMLILVELVLLPLLGAGFFGIWRAADAPLGLTSGVAVVVFVAVLQGLGNALHAASSPSASDAGRRRALQGGVASLAVLGLAGWATVRTAPLTGPPQPQTAATPPPAVPPPPSGTPGPMEENPTPDITPADAFYTVSKNFADPKVSATNWELKVDGAVERPYTINYNDLRDLPSVEQPATLCCISNEVGGDLIGNATWVGVRLVDLLDKAGVKPTAQEVVFHSRDDYSDSIPLDRARMPGTIVVYRMNDAPLTMPHGFPARVIVPGIFGMKNAKWLERIEVVEYDYKGFWQRQGWSDPAPYQTMSRIDSPADGKRITPQQRAIHGVAFAGDRGIQKVEVSTDGGQTWRPARLLPALGKFTWVRWSIDWDPQPGQHYKIVVRATDGTGQTQTEQTADPFPDGATGYHSIGINVASA